LQVKVVNISATIKAINNTSLRIIYVILSVTKWNRRVDIYGEVISWNYKRNLVYGHFIL